jgi:8-oxo-dGTP diphosphatase
MSGSVIGCVGAVVTDKQGRLLMIKRGHEPGAGLWSIPGGRIEPGETDAEALVREMLEETNLSIEPGRLLGRVQRPGLGGTVIDIRDYAATVVGGTLRPGDDAADVRWVAATEMDSLEITEGLIEALTEWGALRPSRHLRPNFPLINMPLSLLQPAEPGPNDINGTSMLPGRHQWDIDVVSGRPAACRILDRSFAFWSDCVRIWVIPSCQVDSGVRAPVH